jgi:hypothetical protein
VHLPEPTLRPALFQVGYCNLSIVLLPVHFPILFSSLTKRNMAATDHRPQCCRYECPKWCQKNAANGAVGRPPLTSVQSLLNLLSPSPQCCSRWCRVFCMTARKPSRISHDEVKLQVLCSNVPPEKEKREKRIHRAILL